MGSADSRSQVWGREEQVELSWAARTRAKGHVTVVPLITLNLSRLFTLRDNHQSPDELLLYILNAILDSGCHAIYSDHEL